MKRFLTLALLFAATLSQAQTMQPRPARPFGISMQTGNTGLGNLNFTDNRIGLEWGHIGLMVSWGRDERNRSYHNGSADCFSLRSLMLNPRIYSRSGARGFFGEAYAGLGMAMLKSEYAGMGTERSWGMTALTGLGAGYRFGKRSHGFYGEIGYRVTTPLANLRMQHSDSDPDAGYGREQHSWHLTPGKFNGQLYWGVGYTF